MTRGQVALIGGLAVLVVLVWAAVTRLAIPAIAGTGATPSPASSGPAAPGDSVTATATPTTEPSADIPTTEPTAELPSPTPEPTPEPTAESDPTAAPKPTERPAVAYAAFVARLIDDQAKVAAFNDDLIPAVQAGDQATVRSTAVDILQFADGERDWLLANPPADCYADAHAAAGSMLEAYATVAERAIDWVDAETGLDALDALGRVLVAGEDAQVALAVLRDALEAVTCLG